ncbi:MAG TPA: GDP-mannose 4,6-dehydratase [Solirubrobacterales bacterium]|nr:GDP-mannose 4,6-dehydratase [Solirubrobacterales bacterium]
MRALVTGGAGFIGSNLVDALLDRGDGVLAVDDLSTGRRENLDSAVARGAELEVVDITDVAVTAEVVQRSEPEAVFHLAAQIDVRRAVRDPVSDASVNVAGTVSVLEAARGAGARVVFGSTGGAIYGEGSGRPLPLSEAEPCLPDSPYGQSKLAAEGYVSYFRRVHGLPAVALRLGNVYGPRQDPLGEAGVIAIFCGLLSRGDQPTVYGDGLQTRDFIHVDDVVAAMLAADARLADSASRIDDTYNVGTGVETSVLDLVERLARIGKRSDFTPRMAPERPGEVQRIALDSARAASELGWSSAIELDDGLERTLASVEG